MVVTHRGGPLLERCLTRLEPQLQAQDELFVAVSAAPGEWSLSCYGKPDSRFSAYVGRHLWGDPKNATRSGRAC